MKRFFFLVIVMLVSIELSYSQNEGLTSKPIIEIFTDFHVNLNQVNTNAIGFSLNRAYFGYNYVIDKNFFAVLILNLASPDDLVTGSKARRYAFFREAAMNYTNDRLTLSMGMLKTTMFIFQGNFYGFRYLSKPFQELNGYGLDSDLGMTAKYKFSDMFEADLSVFNGEGGGNLQLDNNLMTAAGLTFRPSKSLVFRVYDDIMKNKDLIQNTFLIFAGLKTDRYFIGGDFNYKTNLDTLNGHNAWGISATGGYNLCNKWMIFSRYDLATSVIPEGDVEKWNFSKDGSFLITGVQYSVSKKIRISIDYQGKFPDDHSQKNSNMIFLNLVMKI
jgi:hypothetical protein